MAKRVTSPILEFIPTWMMSPTSAYTGPTEPLHCAGSCDALVSRSLSAPRTSAARQSPGCAGRTASSTSPAAIEGILCWRAGASYQCEPVQEADILNGGHDLPRHQAAADAVVRGTVQLIVTPKNGISTVELGSRLGVKQSTASSMKHEIMAVLARRLADTIRYRGVSAPGRCLPRRRARRRRLPATVKRRRGKTRLVSAVSTSPEGRLRNVKLAPVKPASASARSRCGAKRWLDLGSDVLTDGLRCWNARRRYPLGRRSRDPHRLSGGRGHPHGSPCKWVNTTLSNIKCCDQRNLPQARLQTMPMRYLASFAWLIQPALPAQHHVPALRLHSASIEARAIPYRAACIELDDFHG